MTSAVIAYVGVGANLGDARAQVESAILGLNKLPDTKVCAQSSLFKSAPIEAEGDDFINAVVQIETTLTAQDLLAQLQNLEQAAGRERPYVNAPRTLDLDLLLYGQQRISTPELTVPHPRMTQRAFVLIPLLQIDPFIAVPGKGAAHQFAPGVAGQKIHKI
ncbi:MAG: 2-amino-4-hydroxy-6-hydroxymethyldihydropteridine diphosphokinase [Burkholderiales bacterium]|nr:2-amino-4-hydroxy-6-hydroxymethyldihydropteridine diphosphokinase [Burkholderiales bacterium]